jgi:ABC-type multidrug transport system permease subunit
MLRDAWFLARKDVQFMLRKRETLLWTFVMPIVFFYFIGAATGGFGGHGPRKDVIALAAPANAGFLVEQIAARLAERDYDVVRTDAAIDSTQYRRWLQVPAAFTDSVLAGHAMVVTLRRRGTGVAADYDQTRVGRAVYTVLADLVATRESGAAPDSATFAALASMPRALKLEVAPAGKRVDPPSGFAQAVPGTMVMFTLLVLLTSGAVMLVVERNEGLLRRLAVTPLSRGAVVLGKWGGRMALGMVQIAFAMLAGTLLFRMRWGPDLPMVFVVMLAYAGLTASLSILLGNLARSEGQAVGIGVLGANILGALGGCWWPIEITPHWMQRFALFLPTGQAMHALHRLVSFEAGPASAVPNVVVLTLAAVVVGWISARIFRFH